MTTEAAARLYEAEHLLEMQGKGYAVFNPHGKPVTELPVIYGFNNGGSYGMYSAVLLAEDGTGLGGHCCSSEGYMPHDLGILEGTRPDRHEGFREHYPDGYRMDFVSAVEVRSHPALLTAYRLNQEKREAASAMSAGTAETQSGSGLQPASAVGGAETPQPVQSPPLSQGDE